VRLTATVLRNESGDVTTGLGIVENITERKRSQSALEESERKYRRLVEGAPAVVYVFSTKRGGIFYSSRVADVLGYSPAHLLENPWLWNESIHSDDLPQIQEAINAASSDMAFSIEYRIKSADGKWVWLRDCSIGTRHEGDEVFIDGIAMDITGRKQAENEVLWRSRLLAGVNQVLEATIRRRREKEVGETCLAVAEELTESAFGFIGELNAAGRLNTIALSKPGWNACKMPRSDATRVIGNMEIRGILGKVLRSGKALILNEPGSHPDSVGTPEGHPPLKSFLGVPLKQDGTTVGIIALANKAAGYDSSDQETVETLSVAFVEALMRRRAEESWHKSEAQLAHMGRVTTLGEMASGLAHELNQPLSNIATWAEVASRNLRLNTEEGRKASEKALARIAKQVERAGDTVRRMRDFIKNTTPSKSTQDVRKIVKEVSSLMARDLEQAGVVFTVAIDRGIPILLADRIQVQQVLVNLVRNAIEAMQDTEPSERRVALTVEFRDDVQEISVRDNGCGFPEDATQDLFEPFFTSKPDGMGLGLSISRTIVEAHGGHIWAVRNADQGATFSFTLPVVAAGEAGADHEA
jgi:PAS domain S-box-containing protein